MIEFIHVQVPDIKGFHTRRVGAVAKWVEEQFHCELLNSVDDLPFRVARNFPGVPDCFWRDADGRLIFVELKQKGQGFTESQVKWYLKYGKIYKILIVFGEVLNSSVHGVRSGWGVRR